MTLRNISILNFKNIAEAALDFSGGVNCFIGGNYRHQPHPPRPHNTPHGQGLPHVERE